MMAQRDCDTVRQWHNPDGNLSQARAKRSFANNFSVCPSEAKSAVREFSATVRTQPKMPSAAMIGRPVRKGMKGRFATIARLQRRDFASFGLVLLTKSERGVY